MSKNFDQWLELAYLAGLLEGEGSFTIVTCRGKRNCRVSCRMTDKDPVYRLQKMFGGSILYEAVKVKPSWKPSWMWVVSYAKARNVMGEVLPFMGERRAARIRQLLSGDYRTVKETIDSSTPNIV